ncbi:hypothetical protein [Mucilaginibacter psychrotolerans]|uniref:WG repeat-containing protein n=1 Tax=Mucilaginibacter psychrotolerans TaxID=1524096 RepID=A0A4Y8SC19_9SPHI|nr:hypothetical protein [Mucilaginibacter psychrotolerans]TFF35974.1 hypothetical protein E2R66_17300 [Mucilaginibacter psychrotolerans]
MLTKYKDFDIEVVDDDNFDPTSVDNYHKYNYVFSVDEGNDRYRYHSKHGVRVSQYGEEIASAVVLGGKGRTLVSENAFIIDNDLILICCSNLVYALHLPLLSLSWQKELDFATCFGIYKFRNDFLVHGELEISRVSADGIIKWQFGARDIFVGRERRKGFEIIGNTIRLVDFEGYEYVLDENGKIISDAGKL